MNDVKKVFSILLIGTGILTLFIALILGGVFKFTGDTIGKEKDRTAKKWETFKDTAIETQGVITDVNDGTTISFYVAGDGYYDIHLSMTNNVYPVGREVTVYYNPEHPDDAMVPEVTDSTYGIINFVFSGMAIVVCVIIGVTGLAFLIIGIILGKKSKS